MSVVAYDESAVPGLEDVDETDQRVPRLTIDGPAVEFVDSLTGERSNSITCVLLGLTKQRVLWPAEMGETPSQPLCKSLDHDHGRPDEGAFPWDKAGFNYAAAATDARDADGLIVLPCQSCALKEWGTHPRGGQNPAPWCEEQYVLALMRQSTAGGMSPAILTLKRSAMANIKGYLSAFAAAAQPLFTVVTTLTLEGKTRGSVRYAVPSFIKGRETKEENWPEFAAQAKGIRKFLQTPPTPKVETATGDPVQQTATAPAAAPAAATVQPTPAAAQPEVVKPEVVNTPPETVAAAQAAAAPAEDDDLPF